MTKNAYKAFTVVVTVLFSIITILYLVDTIKDLTNVNWDLPARFVTYFVLETLLSFALPICLGILNFFMYKDIFEEKNPFNTIGVALFVLFAYEIINGILVMAFLEVASYAPFWLPVVFSTFGISFLVLAKFATTLDVKSRQGMFAASTVFGIANAIVYFVYDFELAIAIYVFLLLLYLGILVFSIAAMLIKKRK